jgi:hypothetical protein
VKAKVSLSWRPCVTVQVGGEETIDGKTTFVAEEEYSFLKSGFRGYLNRIHESGPYDSSEMDHVGWDALETALRGAFKAVQLLEVFKTLASQNINHKFELDMQDAGLMSYDTDGGSNTGINSAFPIAESSQDEDKSDPQPGVDYSDCPGCGHIVYNPVSGDELCCRCQMDRSCGCNAHNQPCPDCLSADKDPVTQVEDCSKCGPACICDTINRCNRIIKGDDHEG